MDQSQQEFCAALKAARERRGLKLTDIADATKVCPSYFSALERNDMRVWPKGLFRRSFFRAYAGTVGLPVEPMLEEFIRLFPEDDKVAPPEGAAENGQPARLILDESWHGAKMPVAMRLVAAIVDLLVVTVPAAAIGWVASVPIATVAAAFALVYFTLATLTLGQSPAAFCVQHREWIAALVQGMFARSSEPVAQEGTATEERRWFSDARRVRPRGQSPGLRVRFKVSS